MRGSSLESMADCSRVDLIKVYTTKKSCGRSADDFPLFDRCLNAKASAMFQQRQVSTESSSAPVFMAKTDTDTVSLARYPATQPESHTLPWLSGTQGLYGSYAETLEVLIGIQKQVTCLRTIMSTDSRPLTPPWSCLSDQDGDPEGDPGQDPGPQRLERRVPPRGRGQDS